MLALLSVTLHVAPRILGGPLAAPRTDAEKQALTFAHTKSNGFKLLNRMYQVAPVEFGTHQGRVYLGSHPHACSCVAQAFCRAGLRVCFCCCYTWFPGPSSGFAHAGRIFCFVSGAWAVTGARCLAVCVMQISQREPTGAKRWCTSPQDHSLQVA